jgi:hypothetical protein
MAMRVEYSWTFEDYKEMQRAFFRMKPKAKMFYRGILSLGLLLILSNVTLFLLDQIDQDKLITGSIPGLALILAWGFVVFLLPKKQFEKQLLLRKTTVLNLSDDAYCTQTELGSSELKWSAFQCWSETNNLFNLLLQESQIMHIIPKRALSETDQDQLRGILERQISNHVK